MPSQKEIAAYRANLRQEIEGARMYDALAASEHDANRAAIFRRLAEAERRHAAVWSDHLLQAGEPLPQVKIGPRTHLLIWLARHLGVESILPMVTSQEQQAIHAYETEPVAVAAGMPQEERTHARVFRAIQSARSGSISGPFLSQLEGRHRTGGGNALRAAVLGASDGLTSNLSLVMGVAGANLSGHAILLTGLAGLLAGSCSMAIGEWLSVQSARELYAQQISVESAELQQTPQDEQEELALIYQAKGLDDQASHQLAERIITQPDVALDTLAREELGLDPKELGGSAWVAAGTSFLLFSLGAIIPVLPFLFGGGLTIIAISLIASVLGLALIGAGISLTTGVSLAKACARQVVLGIVAATVTFGLGHLIGSRLG